MNPPIALTIAGSDSSGGAGIQADLKTFAAHGVYGTSAVTALTAQNTTGVHAVHIPPTEFLHAQINAVLADLDISATKTGMLPNTAIVEAIAALAATGQLPNLVVDPVMAASTGAQLVDHGTKTSYLLKLFPHALIVTPNVHEASLLTGVPLHTVNDLAEAARELHRSGARYVVVKGGDLHGAEAVDAVYDGRTMHLLRASRTPTHHTHGTGCTFSAAITAHLARGDTPLDAINAAKIYVTAALASATKWNLGAGPGPLDHFSWSSESRPTHP